MKKDKKNNPITLIKKYWPLLANNTYFCHFSYFISLKMFFKNESVISGQKA